MSTASWRRIRSRFASAGIDFNGRFPVYAYPSYFHDFSDSHFDFAKGRLDRGDAILAGKGGRSSSDESAPANDDPAADARPPIRPANDDGQPAFEQNVAFQMGPFVHR
jgi:hypothetical protein